jgi:hypothetical protein
VLELIYLISTPADALSEGEMEIHDPSEIDYSKIKLGMHSKFTRIQASGTILSPASRLG